MTEKIARWVFGTATARVSGDTARFMNVTVRSGITPLKIDRDGGDLLLTVRAKQYRRLHAVKVRTHARVRLEDRRGGPFVLRRALRRPGLLLGAGRAVGVDIDPLAVKTAVANAEVNGVADRFTGICGNLAEKVSGTFDIVAANIVADVVILLTRDAPRFMKPDTVYILSGIIDTREDDVLACLADRFELIDRREEKGWVALAAKLR